MFDGAYHGGVSVDKRIAVTGARLLRARTNISKDAKNTAVRDTVWYNGEQACNVSLAKDGSNRTLFLDFGGETGRDFVGSDYGTHERLLVVDSLGTLVQSIQSPKGYSFDHSEWISSSADKNGAVVASLTNGNGAHEKIVLINLADGNIIELVEGDELWHPAMWSKKNPTSVDETVLSLDSAGVYLTENHDALQAKYRIKMEYFWKNYDKTEILLVGSSRMEMGVNPDFHPRRFMLNLGVPGIDANRDLSFIENYALNHSDRLKAIVFSVDLDNWRGVEDFYSWIFNSAPGYKYDKDHDYWKEEIPEGFVDVVANAYPAEYDLVNQFSERGGIQSNVRGWTSDPVDVLFDSVFTKTQEQYLDSQLERISSIVDEASEKGIYVIGVIFPQAPDYKSTGSFGVYGLQRSVAKKKIAWLDSLSKAKKYFVLMDENKMGNHDYSDKMAFNRDHLSILGANRVADRLDSLFSTLW